MIENYLPVLIFHAIGTVIGIVAIGASYVIAPKNPYGEKMSPYECGLEAFEDSRMKFDVRFYLVAIISMGGSFGRYRLVRISCNDCFPGHTGYRIHL